MSRPSRIATAAFATLVVTLVVLVLGTPHAYASILSTQSTSASALRVDNSGGDSDDKNEKRQPSLMTWIVAGSVGLVAAVGGAAAGGRFNRRRLKRHLERD